jgi:hypothetical protein
MFQQLVGGTHVCPIVFLISIYQAYSSPELLSLRLWNFVAGMDTSRTIMLSLSSHPFLVAVMCTEHTFSQQSLKALDFPKAFVVALDHYKQSGAFDAVRDRLEATLQGLVDQDNVVVKQVIKENCLCKFHYHSVVCNIYQQCMIPEIDASHLYACSHKNSI